MRFRNARISLGITLLLTLCACSGAGGQVVDQRPLIADAPTAVYEAAPGKSVIKRFSEYTCKAKQPYAANTQWMYTADVKGGTDTVGQLVKSFSKHGWELKGSTPGTQPTSAWMDKGGATALFEVSKVEDKLIYVTVTTPCIDQPADRNLVIDPSDPSYHGTPDQPTPTVSP